MDVCAVPPIKIVDLFDSSSRDFPPTQRGHRFAGDPRLSSVSSLVGGGHFESWSIAQRELPATQKTVSKVNASTYQSIQRST